MKKLSLNLFFLFFILCWSAAQIPYQFTYQAVIRDATGAIISNQEKTILIEIIRGNTNGTNVFSETHRVTTSAQGLINITIGSYNTNGLEAINWAEDSYFIKTVIDGIEMGTSQLLSVPYALYAAKAGNGFSGNYADLTGKPTGNKIGDIQYWNGTSWTLLPAGEVGQIVSISASKTPAWQNISEAIRTMLPTVTILPETNIQATSVKLHGTVIGNGFSTIATFEYGTTTNFGQTYEATQSPIEGNTVTTISATISGLQANTNYYYRIKCTNAIGTSFSATSSFKTITKEPSIKELSFTTISNEETSLRGSVNANGDSCRVFFEYGITSSYGNSILASPSIITGNTNKEVTILLSALKGATTYHFRIKAENLKGIVYSNDETFSTLGEPPIASTTTPTYITAVSANLKGSIKANNLSTTVTFEYGTTVDYGKTIDAIPNKLIGNVTTSVNAPISGLNEGTMYHFRIKAENEIGVTYSNDELFQTLGGTAIINTDVAQDITNGTALLQANVNPNFVATKISFEYGKTKEYGTVIEYPTTINGNATKNITNFVTGLSPATTYHYRSKAVNAFGTVYGNDTTFTTGKKPSISKLNCNPTFSTGTIMLTTDVNANYLSTSVTFEYGTTMDLGTSVVASTPTKSNVDVSISFMLTGLTTATKYYVRVKAENSLGITYSAIKQFVVPTASLRVGQLYQGGIIAFIDSTGEHGFVVAKTDQSAGIGWNNEANFTTNIGNSEIGTGKQNTTSIIMAQGDGMYAAKLCDDLVTDNYYDWYLPSKDELSTIYTNLKINGLGSLGTSYYWSSTESTASTAYSVNFSTGSISGRNKSEWSKVRAIRTF